MGISMKKIFYVGLCLLVPLIILSLCTSCAYPWNPHGSNYEDLKKRYETVPFENPVIHAVDHREEWLTEDALVVSSLDELNRLELGIDLPYDSAFFENNALLLIQFEHAGGESISELSGLVVQDGRIYPVITIDSQENLSCDLNYSLVSAEVQKDDMTMEPGELLVINRYSPCHGSVHHKRIE